MRGLRGSHHSRPKRLYRESEHLYFVRHRSSHHRLQGMDEVGREYLEERVVDPDRVLEGEGLSLSQRLRESLSWPANRCLRIIVPGTVVRKFHKHEPDREPLYRPSVVQDMQDHRALESESPNHDEHKSRKDSILSKSSLVLGRGECGRPRILRFPRIDAASDRRVLVEIVPVIGKCAQGLRGVGSQ